jgi:CBS domain-containing protein
MEDRMELAGLCQRPLVTLGASASLQDAAALMCDEHVGALVITDASEPSHVIGVVTDRDLALRVLGQRSRSVDLTIGHLVQSPPVAVRGSDSVPDALAAMERAGVRRLLVLDGENQVLGLLSSDDLVDVIAGELETLARALRAGIVREQSQLATIATAPRPRLQYPAFGTVAVQ